MAHVHAISCAVLRHDLQASADELGLRVSTEYLDAGLHDEPGQLRQQLQQAVDAADTTCDRILLGYGMCGRGLVGIAAGSTPLVVPRVHDCIALFLGSDRAYREQFANCPGTYYISAGWYDEKMQPRSETSTVAPGSVPDSQDFEAFRERYGEDNATHIVDFLSSWRKRYERAVFIDTGAGERETYAAHARDLAERFGWRYERVEGSRALLKQALAATTSTPEVLVVPPGHVTHFDPVRRLLQAVPRRAESPSIAAPAVAGSTADPATPPEAPPSPPAPEPVTPIRTPRPDAPDTPPAGTVKLGLGIDTGGTYPDVVLYDFHGDRVVAKGKAPTTHFNYSLGIDQALSRLPAAQLPATALVSVSTTLATNAIVEGHGQPVGLLLMPPPGLEDVAAEHSPRAVVRGRLGINGEEREPVQPEAAAATAQAMVADHGVAAFAISGYAGTRNPAHEQALKAAVEAATGCVAVCGHELSDQLDFQIRARTAVLNGRIIPLLQQFLDDVRTSLARVGVRAPLSVVKGDGSPMSTGMALQRPVETVLSGPAASVAGARYLCGLQEATVIDIGGTTSDLARLRSGSVELSESGARLGQWRTHVRALDMRTVGLGGDSHIRLAKQALQVGPRRVVPLCCLAHSAPDAVTRELAALAADPDRFAADTWPMQLVHATGRPPDFTPDPLEKAVLDALADGPRSLTTQVGAGHWKLLRLDRLERRFAVQRAGLTPTDLLHATGELALWPDAPARSLVELTAALAGQPLATFIARVRRHLTETLARELLKRQLEGELHPDGLDEHPAAEALLSAWLGQDHPSLAVHCRLKHPVVGLGAPAALLLPAAAAHLAAELHVPEHADVANAIGAITSNVSVSRRVDVQPTELGEFVVQGVAGSPVFADIEAACAHAEQALLRELRAEAHAAGTTSQQLHLDCADRILPAADGTELFLGRVLTASITGPPDAILAEA